ncbi:MAG TPA: OmpA family protein [Mariprofundaceae bacterium]|nr:OmpA family protein [Mariprofundaceae bacterium]
MVRHILPRLALPCALICMLAAVPARAETPTADPTADQMQQAVQAFIDSPDHIFAPDTIGKAQAYVGAALLASQQNNKDQLTASLQAAETALNEAKRVAADYKQRHRDLLALRQHAKQAVDLVHDPAKVNDFDTLFAQAEQALGAAITANEAGQLNTDAQKAGEAEALYKQAMRATLPAIIDQAQTALDAARNSYASHYVPALYGAAKQEIYALKQAADGITAALPDQPAHALLLARKAQDTADRIRQLRRRSDGYESLILDASKQRKQVAAALGEDIDVDDLATDIPAADLVQKAADLKEQMDRQRQQYQDDLATLKAQDAALLQQKLDEQKQQLLSAQNTQLSTLKDAFQAKLAQETFETKRQDKLRKLFRPGEVEVYINLDGSLLVRLTALKFSPSQSRINKAKYGDLIRRLKQALDLYGDRRYRIEGHTDNQGEVKANQVLSLKRAEAVRDLLVADGLDASKVKTFGYGEVRPIASNEFEKGRAMNRRIDVVIEAPTPSK